MSGGTRVLAPRDPARIYPADAIQIPLFARVSIFTRGSLNKKRDIERIKIRNSTHSCTTRILLVGVNFSLVLITSITSIKSENANREERILLSISESKEYSRMLQILPVALNFRTYRFFTM